MSEKPLGGRGGLMEEWLQRDLFDKMEQGTPDLEPEEDDEDGTEDFANLAPDSVDTDTSVVIVALPESDDLPGPEGKHATLLYLGHIGGDGAPALGDYKSLLMNVVNLAAKNHAPFTAKVKGIEPLGDEGAMVWMLDSDDLKQLHDDVLEIDSEVNSLYEDGTFTKHPEYTPHVTIGYQTDNAATTLVSEDIEEAEAVKEIAFDRLALWYGDQQIEFPLIGQS